jgi:hypothetical protein
MSEAPKIDRQPCGCALMNYADGRRIYAPCVPCGLFKASQALEKAGGFWRRRKNLRLAGHALAAVASTIQREAQSRVASKQAIDKALQGMDE